eukprot:13895349-Ditylum_brightwellii.AAC.1
MKTSQSFKAEAPHPAKRGVETNGAYQQVINKTCLPPPVWEKQDSPSPGDLLNSKLDPNFSYIKDTVQEPKIVNHHLCN